MPHPRPRRLATWPIAVAILALISIGTASIAAAQTPPDDSRSYHLITITANPPTPACTRLAESLRHPDVARIAAATKRFDFRPTDAIYRSRYASVLPATEAPIIALVRWDGGVIYKASRGGIPSGANLAADLVRYAAADQSASNSAVARPASDDDPTRWPSLRPRLIPDSVTIAPEIQLPDSLRWVALALALGVCTLIAIGIVAAVAAFLLITRRH